MAYNAIVTQMGDTTGNATRVVLNDSAKTITSTLDGVFRVENKTNNKAFLKVDTTGGTVTIGDSENKFGTVFYVQDPVGGDVRQYLPSASGAWSIQAGNGGLFMLQAIPVSGGGVTKTPAARFETAKGTDTAAANNLTLPINGNLITITGNTQINAITTSSWISGSQVTLLFTGTPTVKHNTAGGAGTAVLLLAGSVDLTAANNTILGLIYDSATGWQETFRKVA